MSPSYSACHLRLFAIYLFLTLLVRCHMSDPTNPIYRKAPEACFSFTFSWYTSAATA